MACSDCDFLLDDAHAARRKYKKDLDLIKPDLEAYNAQKAAAIGTSSEGDSVQTVSVQQQLAVESLYRDANTLLYADHKPTEDAIDRVISKLNLEYDFFPGNGAFFVVDYFFFQS